MPPKKVIEGIEENTKVEKTEKVKEIVEKTNETVSDKLDNDKILSMLSDMQHKLDELKEENKNLQIANSNLVKETNVVQENNQSKIKERIDPNTEVVIIDMFDGLSLNLKINDYGARKQMTKFGQKIWVTLHEARDIIRLNDKFAREGYFIFEDGNIIQELMLDDDYTKIVDIKTLNKLPDLDIKTLESVYKNANQMYQEKIINKFITEYIKGTDGRFRDRNKINLLSEWSGQELMLKITETERANNFKD